MKRISVFLLLVISAVKAFGQWSVTSVGTSQDLYSVDYYSANDIWIGSYNQFVKTSNGGSSWSTVAPLKDLSNISIQPANMYDLALTGSNTAIATGFYLTGNVEYILTTSNGGSNWNYASTNNTVGLPRYLNGVDVSGARAVAVGNNGRVAVSANSGGTWAFVSSGVTSMIYDVKFASYDTVFACGDNKVFRSVNGGSTWTNQTFSGSFRTIACSHNVLYAGNASASTLLKSTDYGLTYTTLPLPFSYGGVLYAVSRDTLLAAGNDGLYVSWSGGQYWEKYVLPSYQQVKMFDFLDHSKGVAVGNAGYVLRTPDIANAASVPLPSFTVAGGTATVCSGDSVSFNNTTAPLPGYTYNWKLNGTTFSTLAAAGVRISGSSGTQTVTLTVSNAWGSATASMSITVIGHDINPLSYTASADSVCSGNYVSFTVPVSQTGITYQLRKGFTNVGAAQSGTGGALTFNYTSGLTATATFSIKAVKATSCFTDSLVQSKTVYVVPSTGGPAATSCIPASNLCSSEGIVNVSLGTINNSSSTQLSNYFDYSCCRSTSLVLGAATPVSVTVFNSFGEHVSIWIDFNNNGSFGDAGELVYTGFGNPTATGTITVPATAAVFNQKLRMRVASDYDADGLADPCFQDSFYCGQVEDYAVTVLPAPVPPTTAFSYTTTQLCALNTTFTNNSSNAYTYSWDFGDGSAASTAVNPVHAYAVNGTYTITLTATNPYGSTSSTQTVTVTNPQVPAAASCHPVIGSCSGRPAITQMQIAGEPMITLGSASDYTCTGQYHLIADSVYAVYMNGNGNANYFLPFLDANNDGIFTSDEALFSYAQNVQNVGVSGYFPYVYFNIPAVAAYNTPLRMRLCMSTSYITSGGICSITCGDYKDFTVYISPRALSTSFSASSTTLCGADSASVSFTNTSQGMTSCTWDFGDGATSTDVSPSHTYHAYGVYTVKLHTSNGVSTDSLVRTSYISFNPVPDVTATPAATTICSGTPAGIGLSGTVAGTTYSWTISASGVSGAAAGSGSGIAQTLTATGSTPGHVTYTIVPVSTGCTGSAATVTITVNPLPAVPTITLSGGALVSSAATGNHWYMGTTALDTTHTWTLTQNGSYTVTNTTAAGCSATSAAYVVNFPDVWPGDVNNDLMVNNNDLLAIGLLYGNTGPARARLSNSWYNFFCVNWAGTQTNGANFKFGDCNGDGVVNSLDTIAIHNNFGRFHAVPAPPVHSRSGGPDLYFVSDRTAFRAGDWVTVDVMAGTAADPVNDLYGIAFDIQYDAALAEPGSESITYTPGWLAAGGADALTIADIQPGNNVAYGSVTRIDHSNRGGYGRIATFRFRAKAGLPGMQSMDLRFSGYLADDAAGNDVTLNPVDLDAAVTGINTAEPEDNTVNIYPNPYSDHTEIHYVLKNRASVLIQVYNAVGQEVQMLVNTTQAAGNYSCDFSASRIGWGAGVYFVKITIDGKPLMKRIVETK